MQINILSFTETIVVNTRIRLDCLAVEEFVGVAIDFAVKKAIEKTLKDLKEFNFVFNELPFHGVKILVSENMVLTNISRYEAMSISQRVLDGDVIYFVEML